MSNFQSRDENSSLAALADDQSRLSRATMVSDTMSRFSQVFEFDHEILSSQPYRDAVKESWRALMSRRKRHPNEEAPSPPAPVNTEIARPDSLDDAPPPPYSPALAMIAAWDFKAREENEISCNTGDIVVPMAISDEDEQWIVVSPIHGISGSGLVPLAYMRLVARDGTTKEGGALLEELRSWGLPGSHHWQEGRARMVNSYV